ncbi:hypothetical protein KDA_09390 [Dictyobacter alpinus]|uniref:Uncharacterized protein n=1 Tax=Dictyobacter alpinus TaxID=2014873 RepID=A0A402B282_9CHLR|nr:hypothetical protein [Dictyobacter alpinus]GCE25455.1 hypothetical protein KDA_09390 [Dictyobacter alpinus]
MPKKSAAARGGAQYQRQKGFELVRPEGAENEVPKPQQSEPVKNSEPTIPTTSKKTRNSASNPVASTRVLEPESLVSKPVETSAPKSASARLAERNQAARRAKQRSGTAMVTAEHFAYVRRDLITIAILATIMTTAIVVLYFVLV